MIDVLEANEKRQPKLGKNKESHTAMERTEARDYLKAFDIFLSYLFL